jgi:hypothetical protein
MARNALAQVGSCVVIIMGLLSPAMGQSQQQSGGDLGPGKSNCDSKTGCANYSSGNVTNQSPMETHNSTAPYSQGSSDAANSISAAASKSPPVPAGSNCDDIYHCPNFVTTGDQIKDNSSQPQQQQHQ